MKICLDTCAFFAMLKYNEAYTKNGPEALDEVLREDEQTLQNFQQSIRAAMHPSFFIKNPGLTFDEQLEKYKDYATTTMANAKKDIENFEKNAQGIFYSKGKEIRLDITPEKREFFLREAQRQRELLEAISKPYEYYKHAKEDYKLLVNNHQMGLVFKMALEGKYEFYIPPTVYAEIQNHAAEKDSVSEKGNVKYAQSKLDSLFKRCTFLSMSSKSIRRRIAKLAQEFRTTQNDEDPKQTKAMAPDKNSLGIFGDSLIMAEACIAGMILISLNKKDFINDKSLKQENDHIRKHILLVETKEEPYTTDALPYSASELLEGKIEEPKTKPYFEIAETKTTPNIQEYFENSAE